MLNSENLNGLCVGSGTKTDRCFKFHNVCPFSFEAGLDISLVMGQRPDWGEVIFFQRFCGQYKSHA